MQNLHTHTHYSDGNNTPMEMAQSAVSLGFTSLGFSDHAPMSLQNDWAMTTQSARQYRQDVLSAKAAFAGQLEIFLGLELDATSPVFAEPYDYTIGSVHHFCAEGVYYGVDNTREEFMQALHEGFHGDRIALLRNYFEEVVSFAQRSPYPVQGHFDLPTKWCGKDPAFDTEDPVYQKMAIKALQTVVELGKIIEVNTGAISRGYVTVPYPRPFLLKECLRMGAPILLSSDTHQTDTIDCAFVQTRSMLLEMGFTKQKVLTKDGWDEIPL